MYFPTSGPRRNQFWQAPTRDMQKHMKQETDAALRPNRMLAEDHSRVRRTRNMLGKSPRDSNRKHLQPELARGRLNKFLKHQIVVIT